MRRGRVHVWHPDTALAAGGRVRAEVVDLPRLDNGRLHGQLVLVRNAGVLQGTPLGDAEPDTQGDFLFDHAFGGPVVNGRPVPDDVREQYVQASRFGEVNAYYHLDRIASYVNALLRELGEPPLPRVTARVHAHAASHARPFQGGHYRLPGPRLKLPETDPLSPDGEIHLGPGWQLLDRGALVDAAQRGYRHNTSHNAGTLYHEYGHHIARHTADFQGNATLPPELQDNRKGALEEGFSDYWAAALLDTPHIWSWHRRTAHPRSLTSPRTLADLAPHADADPHPNGTIWASALWDMRVALGDARIADRLVLKSLLLWRHAGAQTRRSLMDGEVSFRAALAMLLRADDECCASAHRDAIVDAFRHRGIVASGETTGGAPARVEESVWMRGLLQHVPREEIPDTCDIVTPAEAAGHVSDPSQYYDLIAVGDIMLGARADAPIREHGIDFPFDGLRPLFQRASFVLGNLEGPIAPKAWGLARNHTYAVTTDRVRALRDAGIDVLNLANNHLMDCDRKGVLATLDALTSAGLSVTGAGVDQRAAHQPVIRMIDGQRVGLLGYYWHPRCAAHEDLAGGAIDRPEALEADIARVRKQVDRVIVSFHWGIPYEREPLPADRSKARFAVDCGADLVIGHHPHVIQPFEIHKGRPIFYSIGNCAFGSGNSRAEGLLLGIRFEGREAVEVDVFPLYVKNRDPRVNYQPKLLRGHAANRTLRLLAALSGEHASVLQMRDGRGTIRVG